MGFPGSLYQTGGPNFQQNSCGSYTSTLVLKWDSPRLTTLSLMVKWSVPIRKLSSTCNCLFLSDKMIGPSSCPQLNLYSTPESNQLTGTLRLRCCMVTGQTSLYQQASLVKSQPWINVFSCFAKQERRLKQRYGWIRNDRKTCLRQTRTRLTSFKLVTKYGLVRRMFIFTKPVRNSDHDN
jgi:hypothetical protein